MTIIVIDKDPFIRADISETLEQAFPDERVISLERLDDVPFVEATPQLLILDTSVSEMFKSQLVCLWSISGTRVILTDETKQIAHRAKRSWRGVDRPFTEKMLLDAIDGTD